MERHAVIVLGMHRSGTSVVTELLGRLGLALPKTLMPASADNPSGYFESLPITRFNKRMLESAGTHWRDYSPVPPAWFADPARESDVAEAISLIKDEMGDAAAFVLKDPCLCRLVPLWRHAFDALSIRFGAVLVVRRPSEVAQSLVARMSNPVAGKLSGADETKSGLMWMRYLVDSEVHTRDVPRQLVDHGALIGTPSSVMLTVCRALADALAGTSAVDVEAACRAVRPELHRQRSASGAGVDGASTHADAMPWTAMSWLERLYSQVREASEAQDHAALGALLEPVRTRLDATCRTYAPMRTAADRTGPEDRCADAALRAVATNPARAAESRVRCQPRERVLYVSGISSSVGHELRVVNGVRAWTEGGHDASWCAADDASLASRAESASRVIMFRAKWSPRLEALYGTCAGRGIPVHYDVDDLIFDPEIVRQRRIALLDALPESAVADWERDAILYRRALAESGEALVTTEPLARWAQEVCHSVRVLSNTLGPQVEAVADEAWRARAAHEQRCATDTVRIGYASGTRSHHRDFAVVADVLARILRAHSCALLTIVGELDVDQFAVLRECQSQIEVRPRVRWHELPREVARFDVNLAPLESNNPFCECKSEIRCTMASMVGVPTVASPTPPQRTAIIDGVTGWLASSAEEWERCLSEAVSDSERRSHYGSAARDGGKLRFGWAHARLRMVTS